MNNYVLMITIALKKESEQLREIMSNNNVTLALVRFGKGTATSEIMNYIGMEDKEKCIVYSTMSYQKSKIVLRDIRECNADGRKRKIISFTIPISSIGGQSSINGLVGKCKEEDEKMGINKDHEVIIAIINRGYVDVVMDVAREAGAKGGTVVHARGTGVEQSEKFFGMTIGAEKEMIYIVTNKKDKQAIMKAIMEKAGNSSPAETLIFSVPTIDVAGFEN